MELGFLAHVEIPLLGRLEFIRFNIDCGLGSMGYKQAARLFSIEDAGYLCMWNRCVK